MATYAQIQNHIRAKHGTVVKSCWIAHVKEIHGLPKRIAYNRTSETKREYPCPEAVQILIEVAFKHFNML